MEHCSDFNRKTQQINSRNIVLFQLEDLAEKYPDAASAMTDAIEKTRANIEWVKIHMESVEQWLTQQNAASAGG